MNVKGPRLTKEKVKNAIERGGTIREAAKMLGKSYSAVQWWLARNGYEIVHMATIREIQRNEER